MVFKEVAGIFADYKEMEADSISEATTFDELGLDSLDTVELVMTLEEKFGVSLELNEDIQTVGGVVELIESAKAVD